MTDDPLDALRAAAPAVPPSRSRESAYLDALAAPRPVDRLRRWWVAGCASLTAAVLVVAGTSSPALGSGGATAVPEPQLAGPRPAVTLHLTHPDGTVYTVDERGTRG
ncbi:hypothetical protein [Cellulomonas fengjieae]|uniref:Anti-sigma factor n=1 Tax=Cellulomonas fengjieae TaxID=2819978 RepID=A0ABS3SHT2_9CELL|nr:hypothetical protein [Cellulomonas fengjieae]MBO3084531.1 hypothetical protein [Cellulomonas fengjieae]MBO3103303.1 hypothetical protein [Cellulomonas fengjieae]QVI67136.1 hypothetical protein KG102_06020 [Cellulomonas fengjieae]